MIWHGVGWILLSELFLGQEKTLGFGERAKMKALYIFQNIGFRLSIPLSCVTKIA